MTEVDFDPIALHRWNNTMLGARDVVVASYPGSGAALIGNMIVELGLRYVDPYTERLDDGARVVGERIAYRSRLAGIARLDRAGAAPTEVRLRLVKSHLYPAEFDTSRLGGVLLLVRDPRDATHSYYRWRLGFSEEGETGTFEDFLARDGFNDRPPARDWADFNRLWSDVGREMPRFAYVRFEDLKTRPAEALAEALGVFGVVPGDAELARAVDRSSFERMRAHEDQAVAGMAVPDVPDGSARIMRRGKVGEWHEWWRDEHAALFDSPGVWTTAGAFGYPA